MFGLLFSFFTFFLPISCVYAGEIRMYTWAMLLVSMMGIYSYRIFYQPLKIKNMILFCIFSLASCYIHYYGLAIACIINFILLIGFIVRTIKSNKVFSIELKYFILSTIFQILLYLPWFIAAVIIQLKGLSNGFWIPKPSLEIFMQIFIFQFTGNLDTFFISKTLSIFFALILSIYTIYSIIRAIRLNKDNSNIAGFLAIKIYFIVVACIFIISLIKPLLYARYFLNLTGFFIFFLSFFMAKGGKKQFTIILSIITIIISMIVNYNIIITNYDASNIQPLNYVEKDLQDNDLILFDNRGSGFVVSMHFIDISNCFYDKEQWNVEPAYKAFGNSMITIKNLSELDNYSGRIWLISSDDYTIYNEFIDRYSEENISLLKKNYFETTYHNYRYTIALIEKKL